MNTTAPPARPDRARYQREVERLLDQIRRLVAEIRRLKAAEIYGPPLIQRRRDLERVRGRLAELVAGETPRSRLRPG
jgi:hypothetical protein